jgi:hypothetical protein
MTKVTSDLNGWSVEIPAAWRHIKATEEWPAHTNPQQGEAASTDNMGPPNGGFPALEVSVQSLPADQTADQFLEFMTAENERLGYEVVEDGQIVIDGVPARLQRQTHFGEGFREVLIVNDGLIYAIYWVDLENQLDRNEPLFRRIVDTFEFPTS